MDTGLSHSGSFVFQAYNTFDPNSAIITDINTAIRANSSDITHKSLLVQGTQARRVIDARDDHSYSVLRVEVVEENLL
ncbi:hypothetical protein BGX34_007495 [Mortierella sp. NVP85]|nr:hypothetical protein BGX34_007495 [Mortierella sp. NVP85]